MVYLDGVWVTSLTEDLKENWIRHEEKAREHEPLFLKVPKQKINIFLPTVSDNIKALSTPMRF